MALHADVVWEVRTTGSDNNGGGFKSSAGGTDRSQQAASHATLSAASLVNATTTIIDVAAGDYTCTDDDVGNILQIHGGTATAGLYEITARSSQQWTLDRSAGTVGQTVVGDMGGCFASPGKLSDAIQTDNQRAHIKSGTYTLTTTTAGAAGKLLLSASIACRIEGYDATRGDLTAKAYHSDSDNRPVMDVAALTSFNVVETDSQFDSSRQAIYCLEVDGKSNSSINGFYLDGGYGGGYGFRLKAKNCTQGILRGELLECFADNCSTYGMKPSAQCIRCYAVDCTTGYYPDASSKVFMAHCIADTCTTGFTNNNSFNNIYTHCLAVDCTGDGFKMDKYSGMDFLSYCLAYGCGGWGFEMEKSSHIDQFMFCCAGGSNTSGDVTPSVLLGNDGFVTLTADPFTNKAGKDFTPNTTAGGGAEISGIVKTATQANDNGDVGAAQHADPAGGGGGLLRVGMTGGMHG